MGRFGLTLAILVCILGTLFARSARRFRSDRQHL